MAFKDEISDCLPGNIETVQLDDERRYIVNAGAGIVNKNLVDIEAIVSIVKPSDRQAYNLQVVISEIDLKAASTTIILGMQIIRKKETLKIADIEEAILEGELLYICNCVQP